MYIPAFPSSGSFQDVEARHDLIVRKMPRCSKLPARSSLGTERVAFGTSGLLTARFGAIPWPLDCTRPGFAAKRGDAQGKMLLAFFSPI